MMDFRVSYIFSLSVVKINHFLVWNWASSDLSGNTTQSITQIVIKNTKEILNAIRISIKFPKQF